MRRKLKRGRKAKKKKQKQKQGQRQKRQMRIAVVGHERIILEKELRKAGFVLDRVRPNMTISFGGDGSALVAENLYPGLPRLMIKHSKVCRKCKVGAEHGFSKIFEKLKNGKYRIVEEPKVEGAAGRDKYKWLVGLNEINIAHAFPIRAIRFDVSVNGKTVADDLIGDGVIVATPYGSTAYFRTITGRKFSKGLGIAFNNVVKKAKPRIVRDNSTIKVKVRRGPALMCADNNTTMIRLNDGDTVTVRKARGTAKIIELTGEKRKLSV